MENCGQQGCDQDLKSQITSFPLVVIDYDRALKATESLLKMMKNVFYFNLKALFILKIFRFLS